VLLSWVATLPSLEQHSLIPSQRRRRRKNRWKTSTPRFFRRFFRQNGTVFFVAQNDFRNFPFRRFVDRVRVCRRLRRVPVSGVVVEIGAGGDALRFVLQILLQFPDRFRPRFLPGLLLKNETSRDVFEPFISYEKNEVL